MSLLDRMLKVQRNYNKRVTKQARKRREENRQYMTQKAQQIQRDKTRQLSETTKRLQNSSKARNTASFAKGFYSGLSFVPVKDSKNESFGDYRIKQYAPKAYNELQAAVNKERKKQNKILDKAKKAKIAGNIAGTITGAVATSGATKAIASKALGTNAAKKTTGKLAEKLTQKAIKDKTKKTLTRKLLSRMAEKSGRKVTETSLRNAAKKFTGKVSENIAQDVAYDTTFGAAKDISRYIEAGGDPRKNPVEFAKYMAGNAAANTVYGAIGNVMLPGLGALRKGKSVKAIQRVKAVRNAADEATDILSPKMAKPSNGAIKKLYKMTEVPDNIKYSKIGNALNDADYIDDVRKHGINGKSVRQLATEQNRSVSDIIAEDYAKRRSVTMDNFNSIRRNAADLPDNVSATGNKIAHRPGYEPPKPEPLSAAEAAQETPKPTVTKVTPSTTKQAAPTDTAKAAASEPSPDFDVSMGGTRSGEAAGKSKAAYTTSHAEGLTKEDTKEINDFMGRTGANKTWSESHAEAMEKVAKRVDDDGVEVSAASLRRKFEDNGRWDNEDTAEAVLLGRRLTEQKRAAEAAGNIEEATRLGHQRDQVYAIAAIEGSETGKSLNAMKMFKAMTPEGRANSSLLMKARLEQQTGIKNLQLDEKLLDNLRNAKTENEIQKAQEDISVALWDQVPPTITEKLAAWRYLSMLGNPKTHIRNIVGNTVFMVPRTIKNTIASGAEHLFLKPGERTKAILNPFTDKDLIKAGADDWANVKNVFLNGSDKFESSLRRAEGSRVFKFTPLEKLSKANSWALNAEDEVFAKGAYQRAFASYLKANKVALSDASEDVMKKAQQYAWDEALTATYRESNILAEAINKLRKGASISMRDFRNAKDSQAMNKLLMHKAGGTLADALVPFAKTPANILKQGVKYSPASLVTGMGKLVKALSDGNMSNAVNVIDDLSTGVTGTGMMMLGFWLAKNGGFTSSIESGYNSLKERLGTYNKDRGEQEYSFTTGENKVLNKFDLFNDLNGKQYNVTLDSIVPAALPFFQGVELASTFNDDASESNQSRLMKFATAIANMAKLTDPIMNLSMLSSVQNAFDTWQSSGSGMSALSTFLQNSAQSRLGQYVPTVGGQIVNTMRNAKPSASPENSGMIGNWESFGRQQANKLPKLNEINADKSDAFGQKINRKEDNNLATYFKSGAKNFLSPFNIREMRNTPADDEIQRLVTEEGQPAQGLLPETKNASYIRKKFGDEQFNITQKDVASYNETSGQYALKHINKLIETKAYKKASATEKAAMIKAVYNDAADYANAKFAKSKGMSDHDLLLTTDSYYKTKSERLSKLGFDDDESAKIYKKYNATREKLKARGVTKGNGRYVTEALAATEGGVETYEQAQAVTSTQFSQTNWKKAYNLAKAGYTAKQCRKFALTDKEQEKLAYYTRTGRKNGIDRNKLATYINNMNISRREKWARYEVNRPANYPNPF